MLYVRTEKRPGSKVPEHYFIEVDAERRNQLHRWMVELPEDMTLALDPEASAAATRLEGQLHESEAKVNALAAAMKEASSLVPVVTANHLRDVYRRAFAEATS